MKRLSKILFLWAAFFSLASTSVGQSSAGLEGQWKGTLSVGPTRLRLVLSISKDANGAYSGDLNSVDQSAVIPIDIIRVEGDSVHLELKQVGGVFDGKFNADRSEIEGTWSQGSPLPLTFKRSDSGAKAASAPPAKEKRDIPVDVQATLSPTPFLGGNKTHLAYELRVTNLGPFDLTLKRVETLAGDTTLSTVGGEDIEHDLLRPGLSEKGDKTKIGSGMSALIYMWLTLNAQAPVPSGIRHRLVFGGDTVVETAPVAPSKEPPIVIGPPLSGGGWMAANGPSNLSIHRRALFPVDGKARIAQRFAIDWLRLGADGKNYDGDPKSNKSYRAYGSEVLAVAEAVVADTKDGIPENVPGLTSRAVPITLETIGGNYVILDLGSGRYAFYAHMQPGSLRVKRGDHVRRGQTLGLLGNSGNSTEPHLHFHVCDSASPLACEGLPYLLDSFETLRPSPAHRERQLPMQNELVRFPDAK